MAESQISQTQFDITIVGGGMVGATAAFCFSQLGLKVALIEAIEPNGEDSSSFDSRAVALSASSIKIFESLGLWPLIRSLACPINHIHVSDRGNPGFTRLHAVDYAVDALGQVITLEQVGPVIWQTIKKQKSITTYCPAKVQAVNHYNDWCELTLSQQDKVSIIQSRLVIAADGTFSQLAAASDIEVARTSYQQHAVIANIQTQKNHENWAYERFTAQGPIALLPLSRHQMGLVWCQSEAEKETTLGLADEAFCQALQKAFGYRLGKIEKVSRRSDYPLSLHLAERHFEQRILLMGNAAHTLHPIAGQGFNLGLRDIAALNDCLISAIENDQDIGSKATLAGYVDSRQQDWQQTVLATDSLTRVFSNDFLPLVMLRNKAMSCLNLLPFAKRQLADAAMGRNLKSSRLACGISNKSMIKEAS
ncbi:2-octaprenyl-6-methoxyphenyl hydroxylase [Aliikangiella marina]|uniref:2-octaprenyl-6-methoxyphenyl hydroxylase n=1 Tax=Aliikangiella marina TaxID=1712262 RepID=A0A545T1C2_9GAMM|nr:2-octaprenyl-6-methoxyphenyl hydroxylase [Aliikangiella marina]TQV71012.1 2-octaprenyl-6-methoxyphenyl hydroxylase [Aliikangiella marina]